MKARKGKITDVAITHLSAIFGEFKGEQWEPVNGDAVFLMVKGGKKDGVTVTGRPSFIAKLQETWKAIFGPVGVDVADDIDNDGDGADDYNGICSLVSNLYYDISAAWGIADQEARASAVKIAIDNFLDAIDAARSGEDDDSGKGAALVAMGKALGLNVVVEPLIDEVAVEDTVKAMQAFPIDTLDHARRSLAGVQLSFARKAGALGEDGLPQHVAVLDRVLGALREFGKDDVVVLEAVDKADKAPYGNVEYADPGYQSDKKKRYPVDTAAHAKAAWSYINKDSNASKYSSDDLAKVKKKIMAACKKFGIDISGKGGPVADDATVSVVLDLSGDPGGSAIPSPPPAQLNVTIDEKGTTAVDVTKAISDALAAFKTESEATTKAAIAAAVTQATDAAKAETDALRAELKTANALLGDLAKAAREPSAAGFVPTHSTDGTVRDPANPDTPNAEAVATVKAAIEGDGALSPIGKAIKLAALASRNGPSK